MDNGRSLCQWDMKDSEKFGLLKLDLLGLSTLGLLKNTCKLLGMSYYDLEQITLDDQNVYEAFQLGDAHGIFQFESDGMRQLLKRIRPNQFSDISAATALYRPGPLTAGLTDNFVENKHSQNPKYFLPEFEKMLEETYGVIVYQEQVMKIAQEICGFSLSKADILRKAIGKKDKDLMKKLQNDFIQGGLDNSFSEIKINELWKQIVGFADYCFNKSHAYAYTLISYWTMYLKVNHSKEFAVSLLNDDIKDSDKLKLHFMEMKKYVNFLPPDINKSKDDFVIEDDGIRVGFGCMKGMGLVKLIANQPYENLVDIVEKNNLNKTRMLNLINSGSLDSICSDRSVLLGNYERLLTYAKSNVSSDFTSLFESKELFSLNMNARKNPLQDEFAEKEVYGYNIFHGFISKNVWIISCLPDNTIIANVTDIKRVKTKNKGEDMAILTLETIHGKMTAPVFPKQYRDFGLTLLKDNTYIFSGTLNLRANLEGEQEQNFIIENSLDSNAMVIKTVEIRDPIGYDLTQVGKIIDENVISVGNTEIVLFHKEPYGWQEAGKHKRKVEYNEKVHKALTLLGLNATIKLLD